MDISGLIYEVTGLEKELVRLRSKVKEFDKRRKELIDKIITIMKEKGETEVTINNQKYILEEKVTHTRKGDKKKRQDALVILEENGIDRNSAEDLYEKLDKALKGQEKLNIRLKK